jgi:hypothetical protein
VPEPNLVAASASSKRLVSFSAELVSFSSDHFDCQLFSILCPHHGHLNHNRKIMFAWHSYWNTATADGKRFVHMRGLVYSYKIYTVEAAAK